LIKTESSIFDEGDFQMTWVYDIFD